MLVAFLAHCSGAAHRPCAQSFAEQRVTQGEYKGLKHSSFTAFLEGTGTGGGTAPVLVGRECCQAACLYV